MTTNTPATPGPDDAAASTEVDTTRAADTEVLAAETPAAAYAAPAAAPAAPAAQAQPEYVQPVAEPAPRRKLGGGAIAGIAVGGVVALALIFGGGVAVGTILPVGNDGASVQGEFPDGGPGNREDGTRPTPPQGGPGGGDATDQSESGIDTNTQDDSD